MLSILRITNSICLHHEVIYCFHRSSTQALSLQFQFALFMKHIWGHLGHGKVMTFHSILWDVITYPCPNSRSHYEVIALFSFLLFFFFYCTALCTWPHSSCLMWDARKLNVIDFNAVQIRGLYLHWYCTRQLTPKIILLLLSKPDT